MGSTFFGMYAAQRAMQTSQWAQWIIGNNMSGAAMNNPSQPLAYSRQIPIGATTMPMPGHSLYGMGAAGITGGQIGTGTYLRNIERSRNEFLDIQYRQEAGNLGRWEALSQALNALAASALMPAAGGGTQLEAAYDQFFIDWGALATNPTGAAERAAVITSAQALVDEFHRVAGDILSLQEDIDGDIQQVVAEANGYLAEIADLNENIRSARASGSMPNDLMDRRDFVLAKLSRLISIRAVEQGDGSVSVIAQGASGIHLVQGDKAYLMSAQLPDPHSPNHVMITVAGGVTNPAGTATGPAGTYSVPLGQIDLTRDIVGGKLAGLIEARDTVVSRERIKLDMMAHSLARTVNMIHRTGWGENAYASTPANPGPGPNGGYFDFFTGTTAGDINIDSIILANPDAIAATRDAATPGDIALFISRARDMVMNVQVITETTISGLNPIDPNIFMNSPTATLWNNSLGNAGNWQGGGWSGATNGAFTINGVSIAWDANTQSINDVVGLINAQYAQTGVMATFDWYQQRVMLIGNGPINAVDTAGVLVQTMFGLQTQMVSMANMNNGLGPAPNYGGALPNQHNPINQNAPVGGGANTGTPSLFDPMYSWRSYYTTPTWQPAGLAGQFTIGQTPGWQTATWNSTQSLNAILGGLPGGFVGAFNPMNSITGYLEWNTVMIARSGGAANSATAFTIEDTRGNFTLFTNLAGSTNFDAFLSGFVTNISGKASEANAMATTYANGLAYVRQQQEAASGVDLLYEQQELQRYKDAYDAALEFAKVQAQMIDTLIKGLGSIRTGA